MEVSLTIPKENGLRSFHIKSANRTIIGNRISEFVQEKIIEFTLINNTEKNLAFKYSLKAQKMEGSAIIHRWTEDLEILQSDIILITDLSGNLIDIQDFELLTQKWENEFLPKLKIKYSEYQPGLDVMIEETTKSLMNKQLFIEKFVGYSSWRFFFQSWYREYKEIEDNELILNGYFGKVDLPLVISSNNILSNETLEINNEATLNLQKFDRKNFARMLKDLTNVYNIDATLKVDMEEKYIIGIDGWINEAELFLETSVSDWYIVSTAHQLRQLTNEEYKIFIEQIQ